MPRNRFALAGIVWSPKLKHPGRSGLALAVQKHVRRPALFSRRRDDEDVAASIRKKQGWLRVAPPVASRHGYATLRPFGPASFCRAPAVRRHVRKPDKTPCRQSPGGARVAALAWIESWRAPPRRNTRAPSATLPLRSPRAALSGGHVVAGGACAALAARFGQ